MAFLILANLPGASIETLFLFAALFGAVDYSTVPVTASLVASHVGVRVMGLAMGLMSAGHAVGGALGAFFVGDVFDVTESYELVWLSSLWLAVGAGALAVLLKNTQGQPKTFGEWRVPEGSPWRRDGDGTKPPGGQARLGVLGRRPYRARR